jgi:hypothetical protein
MNGIHGRLCTATAEQVAFARRKKRFPPTARGRRKFVINGRMKADDCGVQSFSALFAFRHGGKKQTAQNASRMPRPAPKYAEATLLFSTGLTELTGLDSPQFMQNHVNRVQIPRWDACKIFFIPLPCIAG